MEPTNMRAVNQAAYIRLRDSLKSTGSKGRFVAFWDGQVVADAASVKELRELLLAQGKAPAQAMAVQVGVDYPDYVMILSTKAIF